MSLSDVWIYLGVLGSSVLAGILIASWLYGRTYTANRLPRHRRP